MPWFLMVITIFVLYMFLIRLKIICFLLVFVNQKCAIWSQQETVVDPRNGKRLETVTIGTQVWSTTNLDVERFLNGDLISEAKTQEQWMEANTKGQPAWCYFENNPSNGQKYGRLYNWFAVIDPRGLAPKGFRIPTDQDWGDLMATLGGDSIAGIKMKATEGWSNQGNGNNQAKFYGLPGGDRNSMGWFLFLGYYGGWWSASEAVPGFPVRYYLDYGPTSLYRYVGNAQGGCSIRLIRN
ncbi:MAG: fibrobacter succinogenes major paralogous domain-containing protein [Flavobacteriales bacterium]|jgi:uncharacterized protein (TIGR02145 family)